MNRILSMSSGRSSSPQSFITKGKQRLKQDFDTVYLNNGDEFEIELFNPTQNKVLAKIEMNGNSIGNGVILRPGERIFLERYLDEAKKFLFETYSVDGKNKEVQESIVKNGDVVVKFYNEYLYSPFSNTSIGWSSTSTGAPYVPINGSSTIYPSPITFTTSGLGGTLTSTSTFTSNVNAAYLSNTVPVNTFEGPNKRSKEVETGRIEKGSESDQSFTYDNSSFSSVSTTTNWWKIKPRSTKPLVREDLVIYCTECGSKRKKDNHKFCPHCGTKF
jgi:hypothetical protein